MTEAEIARRVVAEIRRWPRDDQLWWRALLDVYPQEALAVARLVFSLGAHPR